MLQRRNQFLLLHGICFCERLIEATNRFGIQGVSPQSIGLQVVSVWSAQGPVEILNDSNGGCAWSIFIARKELLKKGVERGGFRPVERRKMRARRAKIRCPWVQFWGRLTKRPSMWSATRKAWEAIVSAGFTAEEDGKNELSTTKRFGRS